MPQMQGFELIEPGCSICLSMESILDGVHCASTSIKTLRGRQRMVQEPHLFPP